MNSRASTPLLCCGCIAVCAMLIAACAGNGEGLDANGRPLVPGGGASAPLSADFDSIQENIFTPICSVCHVGGSAPEGLRLDAANSYNLLVGVPGTEVPSLLRVNPGDPDNSYVIQKLEGHATVGAQMPLGGPYLTTNTIAFIRQWITNGAPASAAAALTAPLAITSIVPDSTEAVSQPPAQIMVAFSHELDVSQLATHAAHLEKLAGGASASAIEQVPARLSVSNANLRALMIWPTRPLSAGHYRVVLDAGASAEFSDMTGQTIAVGTANERGESVISTFDVEGLP